MLTDRMLKDDRFIGQLILLLELIHRQPGSPVYSFPLEPAAVKRNGGAVPGLI